jgi:hypothetical protein
MVALDSALVVTSWADKDGATMGQSFLDSYYAHITLPLLVVSDHTIETESDYTGFIKEFGHLPIHGGDMTHGAAKWARKVFALELALRGSDADWLVWIDADVKFTGPACHMWKEVLPPGADVTYLGRPWAYASETGFVGYRRGRGTDLILDMAERYSYGQVFDQPNWGDGYTFDVCRKARPDLVENDLCAAAGVNGPDLHVWPHTVLGEFSAHYKGKRKKELTR